ncbi:MAG: hypothetical protein A4E56_02690 [Pelotomaculum sp. PtaU1.Bin065]|nr:MAG: hypothetical protein A4E56_02690 [Pelotomaculum sp. PtaU1.Bin065]
MSAAVKIILQNKMNPVAARSVQDNVQVFRRQFLQRSIHTEAVVTRHSLQKLIRVAAFGPAFNRPAGNGLAPVGYNQVRVDLFLETQPGALGTGPVRAVEREQARCNFHYADAAIDTGKILAEGDFFRSADYRHRQAAALLEGGFQRIGEPSLEARPDDNTVHHQLDSVLLVLVQLDFP